jgi:hypothetical protein
VYVPRRQRVLVKQGEEFWRTHEIKPYRVPCPILHRSGAHHRGRARPLGVVAWSLWEGYLKMPSGAALQELLAEHQISLTSVRTSGSRFTLTAQPSS